MILIRQNPASGSPPVITIASPMPPPAWALMERELLNASAEAVTAFAATYMDDRGYLLHTPRNCSLDGPDDAMETFCNWTLLYALGAPDTVFALYKRGFEGHLRQYKEVTSTTTKIAEHSDYYRDFRRQSDWLHIGEGLRPFWLEPLCHPEDPLYQERIRRFAGLYMNEDPEAPNYEPERRIIKSIFNGSNGPLIGNATREDWMGDPVEGRFHLLHNGGRNVMLDFMEHYEIMLDHFNEFLRSTGDHPLNLITTCLALNAYMLDHEQKYRDWLLGYVDRWKRDTERNGGNIPANIGLDGTIGGAVGGKWYDGTYGWNFSPYEPAYREHRHYNEVFMGMWPGFGNAYLLTGDNGYLATLRRQLENLYAVKRIHNGQTFVPLNYGLFDGKVGWYNYSPDRRLHDRWINLYMWSMDKSDLRYVPEEGWLAFLDGKNAGYPEEALRREFGVIRRLMREMRLDSTTADTRLADWMSYYNPVTPTFELNRLMQGGYLYGRIYVMHCRVRYFDPARRRAGLAVDVAALVTGMNGEMVKVTLINVNQVKPREVILQASGYGEHRCTMVTVGGIDYPVDGRFFSVRLEPGCGAELVIYTDRYVNQPTLAFPWHGAAVPGY